MMSSSKTCPHCKSSDLDSDPARGDTVCMGCGSVLEENTIVSEVTVQENADGSSSVVGQFVSSEGSYKPYLAGFQYGMGRESRQMTLDNGRQKIREMGASLKLNKHCIDTAFNFFKMAIVKRLSRGRRIVHIVAACLYMTCRTEATPHMLLDFSDITQVNVFTLGKVFLLLAKELHINLPVLDPCMYITRFAHRLDFGERTHDVTVTAMRLVSRMKRDWLHTGRRPSGLCGAALLVAARMHGYNCDVKDIVKVVKIGHDTIRKRLTEFESTPSSQLTINEFMKIDLEAEHDPPAFIMSRIKTKIQQSGGMSSIEHEIGKLSSAIDDQLVHKSNQSGGKSKADSQSALNTSSNSLPASPTSTVGDSPLKMGCEEGEDPEMKAAASFMHTEDPVTVAEQLLSPHRALMQNRTGAADESGDRTPVRPNLSQVHTSQTPVNPNQSLVNPNLTPVHPSLTPVHLNQSPVNPNLTPVHPSLTPVHPNMTPVHPNLTPVHPNMSQVHASLSRVHPNLTPVHPTPIHPSLTPTAASLGLVKTVSECLATPSDGKTTTGDKEGVLDLTDIDDSEIDKLLLSEHESSIKTRIWMMENGEFMKELEKKREQKRAEEEKRKPKQKRKVKSREYYSESRTAGEAIEKLMMRQRLSNKIDYEALRKATSGDDVSKPEATTSQVDLLTSSLMPIDRFRRPGEGGGGAKRRRLDPPKSEDPPPQSALSVEKVILVEESGAVDLPPQEEEEHEEEEDEDEEEEENCMSASQLMAQAGLASSSFDDYGTDVEVYD